LYFIHRHAKTLHVEGRPSAASRRSFPLALRILPSDLPRTPQAARNGRAASGADSGVVIEASTPPPFSPSSDAANVLQLVG